MFQVALLAAAAELGFIIVDQHVADFPRSPKGTSDDLAFRDDPAADTGT